jgi:chaperonin GroEL
MEFPLVLVVTNKIKTVQEITHILDLVKKTKRSLVIFSEDLQDEPLSMMVYNNSKDIIKCCAVNIPWLANMQKEMLTDIAIATGATIIDNEYTIKLDQVKLEHFGSAKKIAVDMNMTHIVGGSGSEAAVQDRIREIARVIATETSLNLKNVHRDRLTRLNAKVAEIEVGGRTEAQRGEIRDLIVDALNSAKSAMMNGVLPGGGVALYQASKVLESGLPHLV